MAEDKEKIIEQKENTAGQTQPEEVSISDRVTEKLEKSGQRRLSYAEYMAKKEKKEKGVKLEMPKALKILIKIPVYILFLAGLCFIPYMLYAIITAK